jgi:hypothetical protein
VPNDSDSIGELGYAVRVRSAFAPDLRRRSRRIRASILLDGDVADRLALAQRNLAVCPGEPAREGEGDPLLDLEGTVVLDIDPDPGVREGERLRTGAAGRDERSRRDRGNEGPPQNRT